MYKILYSILYNTAMYISNQSMMQEISILMTTSTIINPAKYLNFKYLYLLFFITVYNANAARILFY